MIRKISRVVFIVGSALLLLACDGLEVSYNPLLSAEQSSSDYAQRCQCLYPDDPKNDVPWQAKSRSVLEIANAFNKARRKDGTVIKDMQLPAQSVWDSYTPVEKMLYLINSERLDRGQAALAGFDSRLNQVSQQYAEFLQGRDQQGHSADGLTPWLRMDGNDEIKRGREKIHFGENLAYFASDSILPEMLVERSLFNWLYNDAGEGWQHRHFILYTGYNDNTALLGDEGVMGLGLATGPFSINGHRYRFAAVVVLNAFDANANWDYRLTQSVPMVAGTPAPFYPRGLNISAELVADFNRGVIEDSGSNLTWLDNADASISSWNKSIGDFHNAPAYCDNLVSAGYDDWRLPHPAELNQIVRKVNADEGIQFDYSAPSWCPATISVALDGDYYGVLTVPYEQSSVGDLLPWSGTVAFVRCVRDGLG
ncbi:MAG: DUF1566 domain-containing protein [Gammaproteobacteria bacterium]|nr:DUF1566 domain-containing protein [Gammaproteobacteria bacterium]